MSYIQPKQGQKTKNVFAVINPAAGVRSGQAIHDALERHMGDPAEWAIERYETTGASSENLRTIVGQAIEAGADLILAAGGDGTISEVADALLQREIPLGIIPAGTGNSLARELGIPLDVDRAVELIANDPDVCHIDVIQSGDHISVIHISIGIGPDVMVGTTREAKNRFGLIAYLVTLGQKLFWQRPKRYRLTIDGKTRRLRATEIMVINAAATAVPNIDWGPDIRLDDGILNVSVFQVNNLWEMASTAIDFLLRRHHVSQQIRYFTATESVRIEPIRGRRKSVNADGEIVGKTPFECRILPGALPVLVPKSN